VPSIHTHNGTVKRFHRFELRFHRQTDVFRAISNKRKTDMVRRMSKISEPKRPQHRKKGRFVVQKLWIVWKD